MKDKREKKTCVKCGGPRAMVRYRTKVGGFWIHTKCVDTDDPHRSDAVWKGNAQHFHSFYGQNGEIAPSTVDAWREAYLKHATTILRVKVSGSSVHHLVVEQRERLNEARIALCDFRIHKLERWTRVVGEDPCCQVCSAIAMRGRYWVRAYVPSSVGSPKHFRLKASA